eukprot:1181059-Prorocentrum_minimum.AAC.2
MFDACKVKCLLRLALLGSGAGGGEAFEVAELPFAVRERLVREELLGGVVDAHRHHLVLEEAEEALVDRHRVLPSRHRDLVRLAQGQLQSAHVQLVLSVRKHALNKNEKSRRPPEGFSVVNTMPSFYGSSCANNVKGALNTPETLPLFSPCVHLPTFSHCSPLGPC